MRRRLFVAVGTGALLLAVPAASALFEPASPKVEFWNDLFMQIFWAALVVGLFVWGLLIYALVRFRARKGGPKEGPHIHGNTKMEIAWTIAPAAVMGWLLVVSFNGLFALETSPTAPDFYVNVTGFQFGWEFNYTMGGATYAGGIGPQDPIRIEQNRVVQFNIRSKDVIHAFSVPQLGIMRDAIPGRTNNDWVRATASGTYDIKCRELCGVGHSYMLGTLVVFPEGNQSRPFGEADRPAPSPSPTPTGNATTNQTNTTAPEVPADAVRVRVKLGPGFEFQPKAIEVEAGKPIVFQLENVGDIAHNMYIGAFKQGGKDNGASWTSATLGAGQMGELIATFDENATFEFWCNLPSHKDPGGMEGTLKVGKGGGGGGAAGPRPILPGFELAGLVFAALAVAVAVRRHR